MPVLSPADARRKRTGATPPRKHSPGHRNPQGQFGLYTVNASSKRKGFHYKWVYSGDRDAMAEARSAGWREVKWEFAKSAGKIQRNKSDGMIKIVGPCPAGAAPEEEDDGRSIRVGDQMLLAISNQRRADIEEYGVNGSTGQAGADRIENRIISKGSGRDTLRGMKGIVPGRHMSVDEWGEHGMQHGETERL